MDNVYLTQKKFDELLEYSCSLPTGTTIGKKWKAKQHDGMVITWYQGEYIKSDKPGMVGIRWSSIYIIKMDVDELIEKFYERGREG